MEKNEKNKNRIKIMSIIIIIIGILLGGSVIFMGLKNSITSSTDSETVSIEDEIEELNNRDEELAKKETQISSEISLEFQENGFSETYYEKVDEREKIYTERANIAIEKFNLENSFVTTNNSSFNIISNLFYFIFGFAIILFFSIISFAISKNNQMQENFDKGLGVLSALNKKDNYTDYKCPNCGASLKGQEDVEVCSYCGTKLHKY